MSAAGSAGLDDPAVGEVRLLMEALSRGTHTPCFAAAADEVAATVTPNSDIVRWSTSGAMHLTGNPEGPPSGPAAPVASRLLGAATVLSFLSDQLGTRVVVNGPALLGERAALRPLVRQGSTSAGGASRLLPCSDGWVAVTLSRPEDLELVPAWLHSEISWGDRHSWEAVRATAAVTAGATLAERGQELGLAVAVVAEADSEADPQLATRPPAPWLLAGHGGRPRPHRPRIVDLSALWAGPLCANLLALAGADVVTVESVERPDGARRGDPELHRLLHKGSTSLTIDFRSPAGLAELRELIEDADGVVTSARPRALQQLGLSPAEHVSARPGLTWVAITGYGLTGPWCNRVAYGDDAAAAGGLVAPGPLFCADAAADPATGLYAAIGALACLLTGGGLVDVAMRDVARHLARPPRRTPPIPVRHSDIGWVVTTDDGPVPVATPRAR